MSIEDYILSHIDPEPEYLHRLWRATHLHLNYPRMASGHLQGRLLRMLTHMIRPRNVLEIGTFTGYSTLCMASALESGATIHTIEINDEQEDFTRPWLENSPWADKIRFYIGDALEVLHCLTNMNFPSTSLLPISPSKEGGEYTCVDEISIGNGYHVPLQGRGFMSNVSEGEVCDDDGSSVFDLVFIDADKRHYVDYYRAVLPHVRPGGFILADNTLWGGHVLETQAVSNRPDRGWNGGEAILNAKTAQTRGILAFNDLVASDPAVERVILPLRDGLTLIRVRT